MTGKNASQNLIYKVSINPLVSSFFSFLFVLISALISFVLAIGSFRKDGSIITLLLIGLFLIMGLVMLQFSFRTLQATWEVTLEKYGFRYDSLFLDKIIVPYYSIIEIRYLDDFLLVRTEEKRILIPLGIERFGEFVESLLEKTERIRILRLKNLPEMNTRKGRIWQKEPDYQIIEEARKRARLNQESPEEAIRYVPSFFRNLEEYNKSKKEVKTLDDWRAFKKKWYDDCEIWPNKNDKLGLAEQNLRHGTFEAGGRKWGYIYHPLDLDPGALYEFIRTETEIGLPLALPNGIHSPQQADSNRNWQQECPHCDIWTSEIGEEVCPVCGRKLLYQRVGD